MVIDVKNRMFTQTDVRETITNTAEAAVAWNYDFARYINKLTLLADLYGLYISPDGLYLYLAHVTGANTSEIAQWTMSIRWDITTATATRVLDISAKEEDVRGIFFKPDGTKMYIAGEHGDSVDEYNLSTNWDISTAVYSQEFDLSASQLLIKGLFFREDGKLMCISGTTNNQIKTFNITTAWDISTAESIVSTITASTPGGNFFSRDGVYLFVTEAATPAKSYIMTSPFKLSTAIDHTEFIVTPALTLRSIFFNPTGTQMYLLGDGSIQQYSIRRGWR